MCGRHITDQSRKPLTSLKRKRKTKTKTVSCPLLSKAAPLLKWEGLVTEEGGGIANQKMLNTTDQSSQAPLRVLQDWQLQADTLPSLGTVLSITPGKLAKHLHLGF